MCYLCVANTYSTMIIHKFQWWQSKRNKQFYFHTVSRNGKTVQPSEGYLKKAVMMKTINRIKSQLVAQVPVVEVPDPKAKVAVKKVAPVKEWGIPPRGLK